MQQKQEACQVYFLDSNQEQFRGRRFVAVLPRTIPVRRMATAHQPRAAGENGRGPL
jgi:hypothetical protein